LFLKSGAGGGGGVGSPAMFNSFSLRCLFCAIFSKIKKII
jgi:hypothetical protein